MKTPNRLENPAKKKNAFGLEVKRHWQLYLMAAPAVIVLLVFSYLPMIGIVMAFQNLDFAKGLFSSPWCGFDNFKFLFMTKDAWIITRNTILYNVVGICLGLVCSVGLALLINELTNKTFQKVIQTIFIMPFFLSMVVISMIVLAFLDKNNGFVNHIREGMGLKPEFWYTKPAIWPYLLVFISLWQGLGYSSVIYTAVISGISMELYEAAALDGASRWQQIKYITLPHLKTIICINLIRSVGGIFRSDFGLFYTVPRNSGALYNVTSTLDTYIYNALQKASNLGMTTAAGLYQSVVGLILVLTVNKIVKHMDENSALF